MHAPGPAFYKPTPAHNAASPDWTDEAKNELVRLWNDPKELTASLIADELSRQFRVTVTRNAVLGQKHRLAMKGVVFTPRAHSAGHNVRKAQLAALGITLPPRVRKPPVAKRMSMLTGFAVSTERKAPSLPAEPIPQFQPQNSVPLGERRNNQCAYPLGDPKEGARMLMCGDPTIPEKSFCAAHYALCYESPHQRRAA